ncbi:MAG TPA: cbb3-type cytochrome c oxidase subunit II [Verrucomicrobiales bacterium]|jgi:cbb3-type cytochrome oxidase cytochrome c subunit|nr:cbb3-type cytochrome c oxidase subunit II [Verrucomicrobiales bacterium]
MNSLKSFVLAIGACIGVPTYIMAVRPYAIERERQPVAYQTTAPDPTTPAPDPEDLKGLNYPASFPGDNKRGELVYVREGCAQCHTQVVRPAYAGIDQWKRYAGKEQVYESDAPTVVRHTHPWDYMHEDFAMFGIRRIGPDLTNLRYRFLKPVAGVTDQDKWPLDPEKVAWLYTYLYNPQAIHEWSNSPSFKHLFETKKKETAAGRGDALKFHFFEDKAKEPAKGHGDPLKFPAKYPEKLMPAEGEEIIPTDEAKDLVEYLLGLKRTAPLPSSITGIKPEPKK